MKITDSTGPTRYVWDGLDIVAELDNQNALTRAYAHGYTPIEGAYSLVTQHGGSSDADYFYHEDQVGGIHALSDAACAIANTYGFLPFGEITTETGSIANAFIFPATYLFLADCPLLRLSPVRLYAARRAGFVARDPETRVPSYAYAGGNSLVVMDPDGRSLACALAWVTWLATGHTCISLLLTPGARKCPSPTEKGATVSACLLALVAAIEVLVQCTDTDDPDDERRMRDAMRRIDETDKRLGGIVPG